MMEVVQVHQDSTFWQDLVQNHYEFVPLLRRAYELLCYVYVGHDSRILLATVADLKDLHLYLDDLVKETKLAMHPAYQLGSFQHNYQQNLICDLRSVEAKDPVEKEFRKCISGLVVQHAGRWYRYDCFGGLLPISG